MLNAVVSQLCEEFQIEDKNRVMEIVSGRALREYMTLHDIAAFICDEFEITIDELTSKSRVAELVDARVQFSRTARNEYGYRVTKIAKFLGIDHTTVVHHVLHRKDRGEVYNEGYKRKKPTEGRPVEEVKQSFVRLKGQYDNQGHDYLLNKYA